MYFLNINIMENMKTKLENLYKEMENELEMKLDDLGGRLDVFDISTCTISLSIGPSLKEYAENLVTEIIQKYQTKKDFLIKSDSFYGVKSILDED